MLIAEIPHEVRAYAAELGMALDDRRLDGPTWDGHVLHIRRLTLRWHLLHELGHYIAAPPALRALENFGLGPDLDGRAPVRRATLRQLRRACGLAAGVLDQRLRRSFGIAQEAAAAFLTGILIARFGLIWELGFGVPSASAEQFYWLGAAHLYGLNTDWRELVWFWPGSCNKSGRSSEEQAGGHDASQPRRAPAPRKARLYVHGRRRCRRSRITAAYLASCRSRSRARADSCGA